MEDNIDICDNKALKFFDKEFFKGIFAILFYFFIFDCFDSVFIYVLRNLFGSLENTTIYVFYKALVNLLVYLILLFSLLYLYKTKLKSDYKRINNTASFVTTLIFYVIIMFIISYSAEIIESIIISNLDLSLTTSENQSSINSILDYPIGYLIFTPITVVIAPIVEELVFRKAFFSVIKNKWVALVISSFVFGSIHIITTFETFLASYTLIQSIQYALIYGIAYYTMGIILGMVYIHSKKNILAPIACHSLNNFMAVIFSTVLIILI